MPIALSSDQTKKLIKELQEQVKDLQLQLKALPAQPDDGYIKVKVQKYQNQFERVKNPAGADKGIGRYLLDIDITATVETVYIPVSIASGKKSTGFVYQIEGTAESSIVQADVSCRSDILQIKLGTITYCKIPAGKTATFRIQTEINGKIGRGYKIVINRIDYKLSPTDTRYQRFEKEISSRILQFK